MKAIHTNGHAHQFHNYSDVEFEYMGKIDVSQDG